MFLIWFDWRQLNMFLIWFDWRQLNVLIWFNWRQLNIFVILLNYWIVLTLYLYLYHMGWCLFTTVTIFSRLTLQNSVPGDNKLRPSCHPLERSTLNNRWRCQFTKGGVSDGLYEPIQSFLSRSIIILEGPSPLKILRKNFGERERDCD